MRAPALIYPNGTVEASHPAVYTVSCEINIKRFPLDDQRCALEVCTYLSSTYFSSAAQRVVADRELDVRQGEDSSARAHRALAGALHGQRGVEAAEGVGGGGRVRARRHQRQFLRERDDAR